MPDRLFRAERIEETHDGETKRFLGVVLRCGHPECTNEGHLKWIGKGKSVKSPNSVFVKNYFQQKGWTVGRTERLDRCPEHSQSRQSKKRETEDVTNTSMKADPPRQPTRDDKRIIYAKIDEVYDQTSYTDGWSDKRIAADLNTPLAWVVDVRSEFFGDEGESPQLKAAVAAIEDAQTQVSTLERSMAAMKADIRAAEDRIAKAREAVAAFKREIK